MKLDKAGGCLRTALAMIGGLAILIGWAEFMFKPVRYYARIHDMSLLESIGDLAQIYSPAFDWPLGGIVWIVSSLLLLYLGAILMMRPIRAALDFIERSEAPISILESTIELKMLDADLKSCRTSRRQLIHANKPEVDAYHYGMTTSHGSVEPSSISISSKINSKNITKEVIKRISGKSVETIEIFNSPLPTSLFATYLPDAVVRFVYSQFNIFKKQIVSRESVVTHSDEYSVATPTYQLAVQRYPASRVSIILNLPANSVCKTSTARAFLVMNQAVREIPVVPRDDGDGRIRLVVEQSSLRPQQALLITWENS